MALVLAGGRRIHHRDRVTDPHRPEAEGTALSQRERGFESRCGYMQTATVPTAEVYLDFFDQHADAVFRHALSLGVNRSSAEDVTVETFRRALLTARSTGHPESDTVQWLRDITGRIIERAIWIEE